MRHTILERNKKMKKAILNIVIIILTVVTVGYLIFTGMEVRYNGKIETTLSKVRYEEAAV